MFEQQIRPENVFLKDVSTLRERARPLLPDPSPLRDGLDTHSSIALLQTVLAAEIVCVRRYTMISVSQDGLKNGWIGIEFQEQANDERRHMRMVAERIEQLGGTPDFNPKGLASRLSTLTEGHGDFLIRVAENLAAEQNIIEHYRNLICFFSEIDPQSCSILEDILQDEEHHTRDMQDILGSYLV